MSSRPSAAPRGHRYLPLGPVRKAATPVIESLEHRWLLSASDVNLDVRLPLMGSTDDTPTAVVRGADGSTLVAGTRPSLAGGDVLFARFDASGALDPSFGPAHDGKAVIPLAAGSIVTALTVDSAGNIYAAGRTGTDVIVVRLTGAGALDQAFDPIHLAGASADADAIAVQGSGAAAVIAVGGSSGDEGTRQFLVAEYGADGHLLAGFNAGQPVLTTIGDDAAVHALAFDDATGSLFAGGESTTTSHNRFAVAKYTSGGALDAAFDGPSSAGNGIVTTDLGATPVTGARLGILSLALNSTGNDLVAAGTDGGVAIAQYDPATGNFFGSTAPVEDAGTGLSVLGAGMALGNVYLTGIASDAGTDRPAALHYALAADGSLGPASPLAFTALNASGLQGGDVHTNVGPDGGVSAAIFQTAPHEGRNFALGSITAAGATGPSGSADFLAPADAQVTAVVVAQQAGGKMLVGGSIASTGRAVLLRRLADGSPDPTFGNGG
ncbi:MAG TPA: hypothetical protein VH475_11000, partial [Tepidisphaeraceae bacterium]